MTTTDWHLAAERHRHGSRLARVLDRLRQEARIRRDVRRLSELSDAMLRDIGIRRSAIHLAVRFGRQT